MTAAAVAARADVRGHSRLAAIEFRDLLDLPPDVRRDIVGDLPPEHLAQLLKVSRREMGTPFGMFADDAVGFVEVVLGETLWSKNREILTAIPRHDRVAVPSCFSSSKTWGAARAALWFAHTRPIGTALVVTIAPIWRQVVRQMWPEIRAAHKRSGLPGVIDMAQMKMQAEGGIETVVAYGLSAPPHNEAAVQGIHKAELLLVVDESGGIGQVIGRNLWAMTTSEGARMLVIGNPPTDDEGSWFEGVCTADDVVTIPIPAAVTPNLSGERTPPCRTCPPGVPEHPLARHLVTVDWVQRAIAEHGEDSPYVQAKVHARFPRGGASRAIPYAWVAACAESDEPEGPDWVPLTSLGLPDEDEPWMVQRGAWVRLGVDVAADGGDEFVIGRQVGDLGTIVHRSSGLENADPVTVAGVVLRHIRRATALCAALGTTSPVRVKVDANGLGWGVAGVLSAWGDEGLHGAQIVPVMVSETPGELRRAATETLNPWHKRDEMWLAGRSLCRPVGPGEPGMVRLRTDTRTHAQLSAPMTGTNASGFTYIESKEHMKRRGVGSPDRAEAWLLAVYEPQVTKKRPVRLLS